MILNGTDEEGGIALRSRYSRGHLRAGQTFLGFDWE